MFFFEDIPLHSAFMWFGILGGLLIANEITRFNKHTGIFFFMILPAILAITVWPTTSGADSGSQTANWFAWTKVISALIGCWIGLFLRFTKKSQSSKYFLLLAPSILVINILEAVIREVEVVNMQGITEGMFYMGGPWNYLNALAGFFNLIVVCGWFGIVITKDRHHDLVWPDMTWFWIIGYGLWNFAYVYNCLTDRSFYSMALIISATIPALLMKRGAWAQHRVHTLALYMMMMMTIPDFFIMGKYAVASTHSPVTYYTISIIALVFNTGILGYQIYTIIKRKKNPLTDELYDHLSESKGIKAENAHLIEEKHAVTA
jgi:FtsH-binding integral membrane protein